MKFGFYLVTQRRSHRRSREGAWIEICRGAATAASAAEVAPARERGLEYRHNNGADADRQRRSREGAWIEIDVTAQWALLVAVAPARERGLKCKPDAGQI